MMVLEVSCPVCPVSEFQEAVGLNMNLLRNRLIGPYPRQFSTNSPAIRSQFLENLASNIQFLITVRQV